MRKLLGFLLLFVFILPAGVQAQGSVQFNSVGVEMWPEYDRPAVLIIYRFSLATDVDLPVTLSIRIPAEAEINAVATSAATGVLMTADYSLQPAGEWQSIALTTSDPQIQIEYYDPLVKQGTERQYEFLWPGDYAVEAFNISFKLPVDATDFQSEPVLNPLGIGSDNLAVYGMNRGTLDAGETFTLVLSYQKTTERLSNSGKDVEPIEDLDSGISGFSISQYLPWVIGGLGLVLILAGVVYFVSSRKGSQTGSVGRKRHAPGDREETASGATYCHQCGRRAQPGDRFCRACGIRLRRDE